MAPKTTPEEVFDDKAEEALFNELSQARATGTELPAAPPEKPDPEPTEAAPAPAEAPDSAAVPVATAPVPETPAVPETPEKPAPKPAAPVAFDKSQLSKEAREYLETVEKDRQKLESERRAAIGRTAALQRELAMAKKLAEQPAPAPAADGDDNLAEEFPELNRAVDKRIAKVEQKFGQALSVSTQQNKAEVLDGVFPGWLQTVQGPEFNYWLSQQDEPTQKLLDSNNVRDYAVMLRMYELASTKSPEPAPAETEEVEPSDVERIQKERNARLKRSTQVQGKQGAPNPTGEPDESDPEALFNYRSRLRDKERERQQSRS